MHGADDKIILFSVVMLLLPLTEMQGNCITCICFVDTDVASEAKSFALEIFELPAIEAGKQVFDIIGEVTVCS